MDLYEYQGKELFARHGIPVPSGEVAETPEEARAAAERIGGRVVVKAQVQIGGRGKAGGIKLAESPDEAEARARDILGMDIRGHTVHRVWIEAASEIQREYYASVTFDRGAKRPLVMLSAVGGMDIEEVAKTQPEALARLHVDPLVGFQPFHARWLAYHAGIDAGAIKGVVDILGKLYDGFIATDAMLMEINPLIWTADGRVIALDAKVTIDGNALYRHPDVAALRDTTTQDPQEKMAQERGVTYVKLDGDVGILGNGAGLVMSTLDVVALAGGRPANFLDAGGGSKADEVVTALEVLLSDEKVKALLVNIFGGITRCDEVAEGLLTALERLGATLPIVVRLDGTNEDEGRRILAERAPSNVVVEATMLSAAKRAVELASTASASAGASA
ncbi:MAG: succinyl-CoA synthetase beta subunit [Miltoncostaeaceae bacterium]|nr:succinyl-CoA synthetase beta subunit [Miltoncostaeaceae bacterium]